MPHIRPGVPNEGLITVHLSLGALLIVVVVARLVWRWTHPVTSSDDVAWRRALAGAVHGALYLLLLVVPVLGWAASGYFDYDVILFGFVFPDLAEKGTEWAHTAGDVHAVLGNVLLGVIGLHVIGALYHSFIVRDGVMQRMMWTRKIS